LRGGFIAEVSHPAAATGDGGRNSRNGINNINDTSGEVGSEFGGRHHHHHHHQQQQQARSVGENSAVITNNNDTVRWQRNWSAAAPTTPTPTWVSEG
jgi:hypothetical protein